MPEYLSKLYLLLQRNKHGQGSKPKFNGRAPLSYIQAVNQLHLETGRSKSEIIVESSLMGDLRLRQLTLHFAKHPGSTTQLPPTS